MRLGITLRNMGVQSTPEILLACAVEAESLAFDSIWITDHIAIPPDDAEGSGGRYLDTLTTLAWLGGVTQRIRIGSGVLILPYRPLLPTAKQVATVQELTGGRLLLGVGIGWMDAEFRALGVDRHQRGVISERTLEFLNECFAQDEVALNGQPFLFKPRPAKPPILIGGRAPHALQRAVQFGDGWLPMARAPEQIAADVHTYRNMVAADGGGHGQVVAMTRLPEAADEARAAAAAYQELGIDELVLSVPYDSADEFAMRARQLIETIGPEINLT